MTDAHTLRRRPPVVSLDDWEFKTDPDGVGSSQGWQDTAADWPASRRVSVPHSWQEASDLREYTGTAWYRTTTEFDGTAPAERALLTFGAVDYETTVWVNGQRIGNHEGGYLPFALDATDALKPGSNTVVMRVHDPEDLSEIPHGKQGADWYTRVSGPWQSVDLVTVPETRVESVRVVPDVENDTATVDLSVTGEATDRRASVTAIRDGDEIAETTVDLATDTATATLSIPDPDYWTPETPALYDLEVTLEAGGSVQDTYETYFGMRSVDYEDGTLLLNGDPFEMRGALDQAFYPDTYYRPADLDTFEEEIRAAKDLGFNLLRKHIKPAHPRFVELADRMGILVWEEPANPIRYTDQSKRRLREQLFGLIERDFNSPSVIAWSLYNEEWGIGSHDEETPLWDDPDKQDYLEALYEETQERDPTRLLCDNSGWAHVATDVNDYHEYFVAPDRVEAWRERLAEILDDPADNYADVRTDPDQAPLIVSEFGTWGLGDVETIYDHYDGPPHWFDHEFLDGLKRPGDVREKFASSSLSDVFDSLDELASAWQRREFQSVEHVIVDMRLEDDVAGYVITELTDIEWEFNGILDYLRSEKDFFDDFARVNAPVMIHLEPATHTAWSGDSVAVDLVVDNDTAATEQLTVQLQAGDAEVTREVEVPGHESVRIEDAITFDAPAVEGVTPIDVIASAPALEQTVTRSVYVAPDDRPEQLTVYTDEEVLADALADRGHEPVTDSSAADVSLVTDPDAASGPALVVPQPDGTLAPTEHFSYTELPERESWNLCASFVSQDLLDSVDPVPGWAFEGLYPYGYVSDVSETDDVSIGYTEGWLANSGAVGLLRSDEEIGVCTLRVTDAYGDHPIGSTVVDHLLSTLAE